MTTAIGALSSTTGYASLTTAGSTSSVPDSGLVQTAVDLSNSAAVISSFGGSGIDLQTYTPEGLLNAISQAGTAPATSISIPPAGTDAQAAVLQSSDQQIAGTFAADQTVSGIYTSAGTLQNLPSSVDTSSNWATVLKTSPGLSGTVITDSFSQGIVSTLNTTA